MLGEEKGTYAWWSSPGLERHGLVGGNSLQMRRNSKAQSQPLGYNSGEIWQLFELTARRLPSLSLECVIQFPSQSFMNGWSRKHVIQYH